MYMLIKNEIIKYLKIIIIMFAIFIGLKAIAYSIPDNKIRENIEFSLNQIQEEGLYPKLILATDTVFFGQQMDNHTDSIYLNEAYAFGDYSLLERIAGDVRISNPNGTDEIENLTLGIMEGGDTSPYARQWFGSISILRILLHIFTYPEIRVISQMFFIASLFVVSILISQKIDKISAFAFFIGILFGNLTVIPTSINIANSFYVVLISTLFALIFYPRKVNATTFMFIVGGVTSYMDLFVTPLLSYIFLIGIIMSIDFKNKTYNSFIKYLIHTIKCSIGWLSGYIVLWMTKWTFASIVLKQNLFSDALQEMLKMSSEGTVPWAPSTKTGLILASVQNNLLNMFPSNIIYTLIKRNNIFLLSIIVLIVILLCVLLVHGLRKNNNTAFIAILLIISTSPYVWYTVIHTHSFVHFWMTYRLQCGTVFLIIMAFGYGLDLNSILKRKKILSKRR